jgi:hypothetical protein
MKQMMTSIASYIEKSYSKSIQVEVPNTCISRTDKDNLISATVNFLEHNIKINDNE